MRVSLRSRLARVIGAGALVVATLLPAAGPVAAADPLILRAGTDQDLQVLNPWNSVLVADFEVYTLNYDLLVNFGQDLEPVPGFAASWTVSPDGLTYTFKTQPGMKWSDGEPATSEDVRWTYQLVLDAGRDGLTLGQGYLEPYATNAGLKTVTAPDPETVVMTLEYANPLILQSYIPILPAHVWKDVPVADIASTYPNDPPVVGTGPYQAVEFKPGDFIRFAKNPFYWGTPGAADEVIIQNFDSNETMVQALRQGAIDYARGVAADAFDSLVGQPDIVTVEGASNGYTYLTFNGYTKPIKGGGASTKAVSDPLFRDALGWAVDNNVLVDRVLAGHGAPGTMIIPPFEALWHVEPAADVARSFDITKAKAKLDAAGYVLDASGARLDKEGKPIILRMTWPDSEEELATAAQFIQEWWSQLGIKVDAAVTEEGKLLDDLLPPEADPPGKANFDVYMWGWVGDPDPSTLLKVFVTDEIGASNDTFYSNPEYDALYVSQLKEQDQTKRHDMVAQLQNIFYRDAPNLVLYYDAELHAYRTDRFGGWTNQPTEAGTPLFGYGSIGYSHITAAGAASPEPSASAGAGGSPGTSAAPTPAPSASGGGQTPASDNTPLIIVGVAVVAVVIVGIAMARRRRKVDEDE